jgi:outer membrane protein assembly factor BamA
VILACAAAIVVAMVLAISPLAAQAPSDAPQADPSTALVDVADVIRKLRGRPEPPPDTDGEPDAMRAFSPVIGAKPSAGAMFGVAGNIAFYRGDPATTHISSGVGSMTVSTKSQTSVTLRLTTFGEDDAWRVETDDRFQWTSQETLGLGLPTPLPEGELVDFNFYRLYQSLYRRLRPNLFGGGGVHFDRHSDVGPGKGFEGSWDDSPYVAYSESNGLPLDAQTSAGASAEVIWDSRDNFIDADRGWLARASYRWSFAGFLGGDSHWEKVSLDARTYLPLSRTRRHMVAAWVFADSVADGVAPYFDLPSTGSDTYGRSGRGYPEGHFRGERLAYTEIEYRGTLLANGLLGMVAFVNATTVADRSSGQRLFDRVAPGAGAGLRLLINKRSRTNLAFDVGFGEKGNKGVYLSVQEAF